MTNNYYIGNDGSVNIRSPRIIKKIIIHCSDSDNDSHDDVSVIKKWHLERGFSDIGYHFFITKKGLIQQGRHIRLMGAHCITENAVSVGVCLSGKVNFCEEQFISCAKLIKDLMIAYNIAINEIYPHSYFNKNKTCPNFNLESVISKI